MCVCAQFNIVFNIVSITFVMVPTCSRYSDATLECHIAGTCYCGYGTPPGNIVQLATFKLTVYCWCYLSMQIAMQGRTRFLSQVLKIFYMHYHIYMITHGPALLNQSSALVEAS